MYIKREALLEKRRKVSDYDEAGWCVNYQAVPVEDIQSAPAAEVVPVVHGEWENEGTCGKYDKMCCTACTCLLLVNWFDRSMVYRYCPNCGARMDGGKNDG